MTTRFINPKNPLRRTASAAQASAPQVQKSTADGTKSVPQGIPAAVLAKFASRNDEQNFDGDGQLNPHRFAGLAAKAANKTSGRMFNRAGEINAYDNRDALQQAAHFVDHVAKNSPTRSLARTASSEELETQRRAIQAALQSGEEGMALVGQELALPIKAIVDYEGWARKIYRKRNLAQGELFRIAKDVRATAYSVGQDGKSIASKHFGSYILPDEAKITAFAEIDIIEILQFNFDVLDRIQNTARQEIELEEDKRGLRLLDRAATAVNTVSSGSELNFEVLETLRYQVERHRLIVDKFLINRAEMSDLLTLGTSTTNGTGVDPVTQRELLLAGYIGRALGAYILVSSGTAGTNEEVVAEGTAYAVTAPEYLGEMGVRQELYSEPYNTWNRHETSRGWGFVEIVGFGIPQPKAVSKWVQS